MTNVIVTIIQLCVPVFYHNLYRSTYSVHIIPVFCRRTENTLRGKQAIYMKGF